jgi:hypothetical protein
MDHNPMGSTACELLEVRPCCLASVHDCLGRRVAGQLRHPLGRRETNAVQHRLDPCCHHF